MEMRNLELSCKMPFHHCQTTESIKTAHVQEEKKSSIN